jgi:hypothetical protein
MSTVRMPRLGGEPALGLTHQFEVVPGRQLGDPLGHHADLVFGAELDAPFGKFRWTFRCLARLGERLEDVFDAPVSTLKSGGHPLAARPTNGLVTRADHRPRDATVSSLVQRL